MDKSRAELRTIQKNAEAFAKARSREFARMLLTDTSIGQDLFDHYNHTRNKLNSIEYSQEDYMDLLVTDFERTVGQMLAIGYAIGFAAHADGDQVTEIVEKVEPAAILKKNAGKALDKKIIFPESYGLGAEKPKKN